MISNIIKDVSRSVARLDRNADIDPADVVPGGDDANWSGELIRSSVAENIAQQLAESVRLSKINKRDVSIILAAHGASPFTIQQHSRDLARRIRALAFTHQRMSAWL